MICSRPTRFSVLRTLLAAAIALRSGSPARCAEPDREPQPAFTSAGRFVLTVLGPDGKALPKAPVEIRCNPAFGAAQVREGKFLRSEPDATAVQPDVVVVESNANGRVAIELPVDVRRVEYGVEVPGLAPRWAFWNPAVVPLGQFTLQLPPAWSVGGIVVDGDGKPVEGARICPVRTEFDGRETLETRFGRHCRTDANGIWRQTSVPATQREIKVEIDSPRFGAVGS